MVGSSLSHDVVLVRGDEEPSGLADMLQQFLEQILDDDPSKVGLARRISGNMLFRAAEDTSVCVRLSFDNKRIEVADHDETANRWPSLTADFLTTAHMTTGEESPMALIRQKRMTVRCSVWNAPFLLRVMRLMRVPKDDEVPASRAWLWMLVVGVVAAALAAYCVWLN